MNDIILRTENLSKQYRLGQVGLGSLGHDLNRFWHRIRGKDDPYLQIGSVNDRSAKASSDYVWALRDINFEIKRGEVLGIIGKNGAGKSTLLKILSRVTAPTTGRIQSKGRIASLLEVGTGMHPELTGRENIFLNGAILGMTKAEIRSKIDAIVAFSGCELYIDTPVKRYSSGMRVRLGFAVAAFLEPDILVVDEVLAVGDIEFQKKAIGKMQDISKSDGRTVLFVSHNMASVRRLCTKGLILEKGRIVMQGDTDDVVDYYLKEEYKESIGEGVFTNTEKSKTVFQLDLVKLLNKKNEVTPVFLAEEKIRVIIKYELTEAVRDMRVNIAVLSEDEIIVFIASSHDLEPVNKAAGVYFAELELPVSFFNKGEYKIRLNAGIPGVKVLYKPKVLLNFQVEKLTSSGSRFNTSFRGLTAPKLDWKLYSD